MTTEDRFRKALEAAAVIPCVCAQAGTCSTCIAQKALMPDALSVIDTEHVNITLDGYEGEPTTTITLGRVDKRFPLMAEDGAMALGEATLRCLSVIVLALKDTPEFRAAADTLGLTVTITRD